MMEPVFTSGAQRALRRAAEIARHVAATHVEPVHLLWALWLDESHASAILNTHGLTRSHLDALCVVAESFVPGPDETSIIHPESENLRDVMSEARRQGALLGRHVEIGTEHILWGLCTVYSPAQTLLHQQGLIPERVAGQVSEQTGISVAPLQTEVRLSLPVTAPADNTDTLRILDAAANRVREGLRVLEDYVRFALDDAHLTSRLKQWRHAFAHAIGTIDAAGLLASRDTMRDVGTTIHTRQEMRRETLLAVVQAGFKRVQEAARTLEEYGKVLSPEFGGRLGELRYDLYTLEKAVLLTHASRERLAGRDLYLLVTEELCRHGSGPAIRAALDNGVSIVQVREKKMPDRRLLEHALRVREWTAGAGALFIMNDRPDLAVLAGADGVHVGQDELSVRDARRIVGPHKIVGVSTHSIEQARQAVLDGADYIGVGPVFSTTTKNFDQLAGLDFVRQVAAETMLPAFAIGGIGPQNIDDVLGAGARRVAVSSAICSDETPDQITRDLLAAIRRSGAR